MITITEVSFSYPDGTRAMNNLSLCINTGCTLGIIGANGAGKSTLLNHLNGWHIPSKGTIAIGNTIVCKKKS